MSRLPLRQTLLAVYERLFTEYGPQHWWPAQTPFEVIVGAILTQSAAWTNVEKAIANLTTANTLSPQAIHNLPEAELAALVRPSGYYNAKAHKIKAFVEWLHDEYDGNLDRLFATETMTLRQRLLGVHGIGEETADSIILYAANKPVFVVDAYTRRITTRYGIAPEGVGYADYQTLFMKHLPTDVQLFNEYHALLVCLGKNICRKIPKCGECCLNDICAHRH